MIKMSEIEVERIIFLFLISASFPFISGIYAWYYNMKLVFYIKQSDDYKYQYLWGDTYAGYGDPSNFLAVWRYIYSNEENDEVISDYKNKIRNGLKYFLYSLFFAIVMALIMVSVYINS